MADAAQIAEGIVDNLEPLKDRGFQTIKPYLISSPTPPCIYVTDGKVELDKSMGRGRDYWVFMVVALVTRNNDQIAQETLRRLRNSNGSDSVKALIESDKKLAGIAINLQVTEMSEIGTVDVDGVTGRLPLGCHWTVVVAAPGNNDAS